MIEFEQKLNRAIVLLEGVDWFITPQEIYDYSAMMEGGALEDFSLEVNTMFRRLMEKTRELINDRVFTGAFYEYISFPTKEVFVRDGGNPALWDRVVHALGNRLVQKEYGPDWPGEDVAPYPILSDGEIDNCFQYIGKHKALTVSSMGRWRFLWENYKDAKSLPEKNEAIEIILSSYHHSGRLMDYLAGTPSGHEAPKWIQLSCINALSDRANKSTKQWWHKVSRDVRIKVNKSRRKAGLQMLHESNWLVHHSLTIVNDDPTGRFKAPGVD